MTTRKRKTEVSNAENGPAEISPAAAWVAPTDEEFKSLKRYKSFLLPPNNSYASGQFVWLAHEAPKPTPSRARTSSALPPEKKPRTSVIGPDGLPTPEPSPPGPLERIHAEVDSDPHWNAGLWIGKIIEIRAKDTSYVWMRIRWMCRSFGELKDAGVQTGMPRSKAGVKEVFMLGEEHDMLQPVGAVEGAAPVIVFDERNPLQAPFGSRKIFLRSEARTPTETEIQTLSLKRFPGIVEPRSKKRSRVSTEGDISKHPGHLFPLRPPTCYCGDPYRPEVEREEPMAMCAHKDCLKWFHFGCLDWKNHHRRTATPSAIENVLTSGVDLMTLLPDYGLTTPAGTIPFGKDPSTLFATPAKDALQNEGKTDELSTSIIDDTNGQVPQYSQELLDRYTALDEKLPNSVLRFAESPITRGTIDTGIVGNARLILRARQIVLENRKMRNNPKIDALQMAVVNEMIEEWKNTWEIDSSLDEKDNAAQQYNSSKSRSVIWLCPSCRRAM
ncbi:uncharacterized protein I206_106788 [Kwoniella pini CBS 10737]|uniref:BAH domain-containing protein n=1 Tax=Kwoniella pini CBS 10737 TaxID=1296096 RepID=A0A1B9HT75_9TREE|nr:uncharacterized protein I206_07325 [Kwoniella pini CBS 10737]OCF46472.1 hypothetical protein I206_07325 [Kwoniella pini CBS 10737]